MELYHNDQPHFTRWVIGGGLLKEPLVVIDVGVQGGEHPRWEFLGDHVRVFGFDALSEAIDRVKEKGERPNRTYRALAIGNEDGEREFYVPQNTFDASFYRMGDMAGGARHGDGASGPRKVPIRKLDTLFAAGELPPADYIKTDCEGFDPQVLHGAQQYMEKSNVLGVVVETTVYPSPDYVRTPLTEILDCLIPHRLVIFDINAVRIPRASYAQARQCKPWPQPDPLNDIPFLCLGQPRYCDFFFARDFHDECIEPRGYYKIPGAVTAPTIDKLIKAMIIFELHGLMDCAVDIAVNFRQMLAERLDVDKAIDLLVIRPPHARNDEDVIECLKMIGELRVIVQAKNAEIANAVPKTARQLAEARAQLAAARMELEQSRINFESRLKSVRFLARALWRETMARVGIGTTRPR